MISHTPTYNLMVILKETGLKADVLRAWEKRYNLPHPQRSPGGHRLYSDYDIATVKWLKDRQAEGMRISQAVKLWNELNENDQDPLEQAMHKFILPTDANSETSMESLRQQWLDGCLAFDSHRAEDALNQAFALYPIEKVCIQILQKGMNLIGEGWYQNRVSVQQEHFASELAVRRLEALINAAPRPTRSHTIVTGCPAGEMHTIPILLLSLLLQRAGYKVVYLGANLPAQQMNSAVSEIHPDLVVFACQQLSSAANLSDTARILQEMDIPLAYGGKIFNLNSELRQRIPGVFLGEKIEEVEEKVEQILQSAPVIPAVSPNENFRKLADLFKRYRPLIERALYPILEEDVFQSSTLDIVNAFFGNRMEAALNLGDPM
jgi:methanogenic corrinoid protein MtbC1